MRIFLDDIRDAPLFNSYGEEIKWDRVIRHANEAIDLVKTGEVTFISFDHDLGDNVPSGYDVAKVIERLAASNRIPPIDYRIHSGNPVGSKAINAAMQSAWRFWEESA